MLRILSERLRGAAEQPQTVAVGEDFVPLLLRRHAGARRLRLRYDAMAQALRLTVPPHMSQRAALDWAAAQQEWIATQRAKALPPVLVAPGLLLPVDGHERLIRQDVAAPRQPVLDDDTLLLGGDVARVGPRLARWLVMMAVQRFDAQSRALAAGARLDVTSVRVGDPRGRWGSCNADGNLRYSWRLIMAPVMVQRSVIAHEVAHLAHLNHGPAFHRLADALYGDDPAAPKAWLAAHGRGLHRFRFG